MVRQAGMPVLQRSLRFHRSLTSTRLLEALAFRLIRLDESRDL